jgi:hypothetical protein
MLPVSLDCPFLIALYLVVIIYSREMFVFVCAALDKLNTKGMV